MMKTVAIRVSSLPPMPTGLPELASLEPTSSQEENAAVNLAHILISCCQEKGDWAPVSAFEMMVTVRRDEKLHDNRHEVFDLMENLIQNGYLLLYELDEAQYVAVTPQYLEQVLAATA